MIAALGDFTVLHRMDMPPEGAPAEVGVMSFDRWTHSYRDTYNNIWLVRRSGYKQWELISREAGNKSKLWSRHRDIETGLKAANRLHAEKSA